MDVKRGGRQGQSLRSLRPHIGMCSLNARDEGSTPPPAGGWLRVRARSMRAVEDQRPRLLEKEKE